ncbi:hypothetical protein [Paraburkholderia azotifigens]|uniref:hypothetical protein n=1 Tax=Paraburkholderia azotifigens TaxID=2057004 RepID=UPI0038B76270
MKRILIAVFATLAVAFGQAATLSPVQLLNPTGSTSGQAIVSTGPSTAPAWGGVGVGGIAAIAANTVLANAAGTSASPTAFSMPSCSSATSVLQYTSGTGFTCSSAFLTSPTITTPNIVGVTNGSAAAAGQVGEIICAQVTNGGSPTGCATNSSTPVSLTNVTPANITSITLTAGDWDVWGFVATNPAGTTIQQNTIGAISTVSVSIQTPYENAQPFTAATGVGVILPIAPRPINVSTTTTVYLIAYSGFTTSTNAAYGYIVARRRH